MATKTKVKKVADPTPVSFIHNDLDFKVATLANFGWALQAIADKTGLTKSQVSYRCRQSGVSVKAYRNGRNEHAIRIVEAQKVLFSAKEIKEMREKMEEARAAILQKLRK
jgi:hypothetical protein